MSLDNIERVLISEAQIAQKVSELGACLTEKYKGKNPLFICPLKGSVMFFADLLRKIDTHCEIDFMAVSSYGNGTVSTGKVSISKELDRDINGRNAVIVEDIIDTGNTLSELRRMLLERQPASLEICTLLDKPSRRIIPLKPDYSGFTIPDLFVVGYGMDLDEKYRNLPFIGVYRADPESSGKSL